MPWATPKQFAFRSTLGFVTDPANTTFASNEQYPHNYSIGGETVVAGWVSSGSVTPLDRNNAVDPRIAGMVLSAAGTPATFKVDLPAAGDYTLHLAMGDSQGNVQQQTYILKDGSTSLGIFKTAQTSAGLFDATGADILAPSFFGSEVGKNVTFAGTQLTIVLGDATDRAMIAYLSLTQNAVAPTATHLGRKTEQLNRYDPSHDNGNGTFGAYVLTPVSRQDNYVAATGKPFDYRHQVVAYNADGSVDTTFTGQITAAVTVGTCTLGGTVTRNAIAGIADFSDLFPATGTGALAITYSTPGLTSFTTATMTVVTPQYDQYALDRGLLVELPRLAVDMTYPSSFVNDYTLDPAQPPSATNVQTFAAAIAKVVTDNATGATRFKVAPGTYTEKIMLAVKSNTGLVVFEPAGGIPGTSGVRVSPADFAANAVTVQHSDTTGVVQCAGAAHHYRFYGIAFTPVFSSTSDVHNAIIDLDNQNFDGDLNATLGINDFPSYIGFDRCYIYGLANHTTRKGVFAEGRNLFVTNCYLDEIHATRSPDMGSGDEQAISMVGAPGPVLIENNALRASGETILIGGGNPWFYDMKPRDLTVRRNVILAPTAWQLLYKHKNNTELKSVGRILFEGNAHDGAWDGNQDGTGLQFSSANQAYDKPYAANYSFEGIEDIVVRKSFARTMQVFMALTGVAAPNSSPAKRASVHDNVAVNINAPVTWLGTGSSGTDRASFLGGLSSVAWGHNTVLANPNALNTKALLLQDPAVYPNLLTFFRDNIVVCRGYGILGDNSGIGTVATSVAFPDDTLPGNVFYEKSQAGSFPAGSFYPSTLAGVGFTDVSGIAGFDTADPDTICAGLLLTNASPYKAQASDGTDPGADITAVRAAIQDVWNGGGAAPLVATSLGIVTNPAGAVAGLPFTTQLVAEILDQNGARLTTATDVVNAALYSGAGALIGTQSVAAVAGLVTFTDLGCDTAGTGKVIRLTSGMLTPVDTASFTVIDPVVSLTFVEGPTRTSQPHVSMKQGDTGPALVVQLLGRDGSVQSLPAGTVVKFSLEAHDGTMLVTKATCQIQNARDVVYQWNAQDIADVGVSTYEIEATFPDQRQTIITFPNRGVHTVTVTPQLA